MNSTIKEIESILKNNKLELETSDLVLSRCFSEAWFSDTLAWLLDPKGSHKLGVRFLNEFIKTIAKKRSSDPKYKQRVASLRWGKSGIGTTTAGFSFKNSSPVRELYLSQPVGKNDRIGRFADIAIIDLDVSDGIVVVIENKLFTVNHPRQLTDTYLAVEDKYRRAKIREYVYLTLDGRKPTEYTNSSPSIGRRWLRVSWCKDVLPLLSKFKNQVVEGETLKLIKLLSWMNELDQKIQKEDATNLQDVLISAVCDCLSEELKRLGEGKTGAWIIEKRTIHHTSFPARKLKVDLLPNFTITISGVNNGNMFFEKIVMPFGVHVDQVYNMIDISARDIYHILPNTKHYLNSSRRMTVYEGEEKARHRQTFEFISRNSHALRVILLYSKYVWTAEKEIYEE